MAVDWRVDEQERERHPIPIVINAYDREGLMRDIGSAVADEGINIRDISSRTHDQIATFEVVLEIENAAQLSRVLSRIAHIPNVMEARRRTM